MIKAVELGKLVIVDKMQNIRMQVLIMKLRMKEQWICILLAAVLLVMGMQAEVAPVNPSSLRGENVAIENVVVENVSYSMLRKGVHFVEVNSNCTIDMLRRNVSTYQNSNEERTTVRRFLRVTVLLLLAESLLLQRFFCDAAIEKMDIESIRCHIATVLYIHQKDGKK